jgi:Protein of unknown function DUF262
VSADSWHEGDIPPEEEEEGQIDEYDLNSTPNDFNVVTIYNFIDSGAVKIPGFQRAYVWDLRRASKLIESLIIGLPVPQVFLYEEGRNSFLVIDGQQRLMTMYYFMMQRFLGKSGVPNCAASSTKRARFQMRSCITMNISRTSGSACLTPRLGHQTSSRGLVTPLQETIALNSICGPYET